MSAAARWMVVTAIALASAGAVVLAISALPPAAATLRDALIAAPVAFAIACVAPLLAGLLAAVVMRTPRVERDAPAASTTAATSARPAADRGAAALQLLGLLQQEGRLVDFLEEDLTAYSDEQIGAAVRSIHEGCRGVLRERVDVKPILAAAEGATVTVERGFDPAAVRVIGNVRGEPPYHGVLRHPGWRAEEVKLPQQTGDRDATILAPAEVEVL